MQRAVLSDILGNVYVQNKRRRGQLQAIISIYFPLFYSQSHLMAAFATLAPEAEFARVTTAILGMYVPHTTSMRYLYAYTVRLTSLADAVTFSLHSKRRKK